MENDRQVKPYFKRIKNWKVQNMVMGYLEARDRFKHPKEQRIEGSPLQESTRISFEEMCEISNILYDLKENQHLIYRRLVDPQKEIFDDSHKFHPDQTTTDFLNNVGLLFHKVMVARELNYLLVHYVEHTAVCQENMVNLEALLAEIDELFDEGVAILERYIHCNTENPLLLTLLLQKGEMVKKHFGARAEKLLLNFCSDQSMDEIYYKAGQYYAENGRIDQAAQMLRAALKRNENHNAARVLLSSLKKIRQTV